MINPYSYQVMSTFRVSSGLAYPDYTSLSSEGLFCIFIVDSGFLTHFFLTQLIETGLFSNVHVCLSWIQDFSVLNRNADGGEILLSLR